MTLFFIVYGFCFFHPRKGRQMLPPISQMQGFSRPALSHVFDQTQLGFPKLTQNYSTHGKRKGPKDVTLISKNPTSLEFLKISMITAPHRKLTQVWLDSAGITGKSIHEHESAVHQPACVPPHQSPCRSACLARWQSRGWWGPACPVCVLLSPVHCSSRGSPGSARTSTDAAWSSCLAPPAAATL